MKWLWNVLLALLSAGVLAAAEMIREYFHFKVTRYTLCTDQIETPEEGIKLIFLSDLHNRIYGKNNDKLFDAIYREHPDLILIGGDMIVDRQEDSTRPVSDFICRLLKLCPVYYANGNHEQRWKEHPGKYNVSYVHYKQELERFGVVFLENRYQDIHIKGATLRIYGLELPLDTYRKFVKSDVEEADLTERIGRLEDTDATSTKPCYHILMAHNPTYMEAYKSWGADMILCGHLHGGLVRLPLIGGVITPQAFLFPAYSGEMKTEGRQTMIVSKGLGSHTVNIRLFNTPEVVSITLRQKSSSSVSGAASDQA